MEVLFEFIRIGSIVRVTAVDAETGTEAVIQGPANMPQETLQRNAANKLRYILEKHNKTS